MEVRNRFKGLNLIDIVPEELWKEAGIKTIPKKKKCKKAKRLFEEALQIAVKRREAKGKGEKERYLYLNEVKFSSVTQSCPTLCDPVDCSTPGLPVHHQLPEFTQTHVH